MTRRRIAIALLALLVVVLASVAVGLVVLPGVARRLAVEQVRALTGRDFAIDDLQLDLFRRRLALTGVRLGDGPGRPPFAELAAVEVRFRMLPLVRGRLHLDAVSVVRPVVRVVRIGPSEFNFTELLERFGGGEPAKEPAHVAVGHLTIADGTVTFDDQAVAPPRRFEATGIGVEVRDVATVGDAARGTARVAMSLDGAPVTVSAEGLRVRPARAQALVTVAGLDLAPLASYVPADAPVRIEGGRFTTRLELQYDAVAETRAGGEVSIAELLLSRRGQPGPFVTTPVLSLTSRDVVYRDGTLTAGRLTVEGSPSLTDATVTPPQQWDLRNARLAVEDVSYPARGLGRLQFTADLPKGGALDVAGGIAPYPTQADLTVRVRNVDLTLAAPYVPATTPVVVTRGRLASVLGVKVQPSGIASIGGTVTVTSLAVGQRGAAAPFLHQPRLDVAITDLVVQDGAIALARVRIAGAPTVVDASVTPPRQLALRGLRVDVERATWPARGPLSWTVAADLPDAGSLLARGTASVDARTFDGTLRLTDAALGVYEAFLPIAAPIDGRADAALALKGSVAGTPTATVTGQMQVRRLRVGPTDGAPVRIERVDVGGIELVWPERLRVDRVVVSHPSALIERDRDGSFPLRTMLAARHATVDSAAAAAPESSPSASPSATAPPERARFAIEVGTLAIEDGDARFVDRTTTPFYSEEITRLALTLRGLSTAPDRRGELAAHAVVGGTGALQMQGEVAPFGQPFLVDVAGELRELPLTRTNPYVQRFLDWVVGSGRLTTRFHYRITGDELEATNDLLVERLAVTKLPTGPDSDKKIGLPLGLAVSILKDTRGDIRLSVPVGGKLSSPEFSFGQAIVSTLKNVVTKLVTAPFRAVGRLFGGGDKEAAGELRAEDLKIDPVPFDPGTAAVTPDAEQQLQRVADFLRASPGIALAVRPVVTATDVQALRVAEVNARVQRVQRETGVADFAEAATRVFRARLPDRTPPKTTDELLSVLREEEPVPTEAARALATRRVDEARRVLIQSTGIPRERLRTDSELGSLEGPGGGRLEFELVVPTE